MFYRNQLTRQIFTTPLFVTFCGFVCLTVNINADTLHGDLQKGRYGVGFRVMRTYDYSRAYKGEQGRPMQIAVWYPTNTKAPGMRFSEYLDLFLTEESFKKPAEKARQENAAMWKKELAGRVDPAADSERILQAQTFAVQDAPPAKGSFPVLIYGAGGQGESFENSVMLEYLASHGYIALASPAVGPYEHKTTVNAVGLEAAARDMEFLIAQAKQFVGADLSRLAVMGWSWGGLAALLVQMRNPNVDAVLSLDGSIATHEDKIRATAFFSPQRVRVPAMFMSTHTNAPRFEGVIQKLKYSEGFLLELSDITHSDFNSYGFIARNFAPSLTEAESRKKKAYELIGHYALGFFDAFLKGDASSREFLRKPTTNKELLTIAYKPSLPLPPTQEEFFTLLQDKGIQPAYKVFEEVMKRDPDYQIFEAFEMTVLADRLYKAGREDDAISAAKLRVKAYPNDYLSYEWVANLYYKKRDWTNALQYYVTAFEMALEEPQTAQLTEEIDWYRKRIETVKGNLARTH